MFRKIGKRRRLPPLEFASASLPPTFWRLVAGAEVSGKGDTVFGVTGADVGAGAQIGVLMVLLLWIAEPPTGATDADELEAVSFLAADLDLPRVWWPELLELLR